MTEISASGEAIGRHFLEALGEAAGEGFPFRHWLLRDALPADAAHAIPALPIAPPAIDDTQGKRETHNATRSFFAGENLARFPVARAMADCFQSPETVRQIERATGATLAGSSLRIEYCQDTDGFWLAPHTDIGAKLFTMLIYLSESPEAAGWGTDIYDDELRHAGSAPGGFNRGLIFVPGPDTWHGVEQRRFKGVRKSVIVNYVKPEWRARHELAFPDRPVG